jgi:hypothetical protein
VLPFVEFHADLAMAETAAGWGRVTGASASGASGATCATGQHARLVSFRVNVTFTRIDRVNVTFTRNETRRTNGAA